MEKKSESKATMVSSKIAPDLEYKSVMSKLNKIEKSILSSKKKHRIRDGIVWLYLKLKLWK